MSPHDPLLETNLLSLIDTMETALNRVIYERLMKLLQRDQLSPPEIQALVKLMSIRIRSRAIACAIVPRALEELARTYTATRSEP